MRVNYIFLLRLTHNDAQCRHGLKWSMKGNAPFEVIEQRETPKDRSIRLTGTGA